MVRRSVINFKIPVSDRQEVLFHSYSIWEPLEKGGQEGKRGRRRGFEGGQQTKDGSFRFETEREIDEPSFITSSVVFQVNFIPSGPLFIPLNFNFSKGRR